MLRVDKHTFGFREVKPEMVIRKPILASGKSSR